MKKMLKLFKYCFGILFILSIGCTSSHNVVNNRTIQKRKYQKGFWVKNTSKNQEGINNPKEPTNIIQENTKESFYSDSNILLASVDNDIELLLCAESESQDSVKCDLILKKNGDEIEAKILEITENSIKYKKCNFIDGPTYNIAKTEVFKIKYSNGSQDLILDTSKKNINTKETNYNSNQTPQNTPNNSYNNTNNLPQRKTIDRKGSFGLASVLCAILGYAATPFAFWFLILLGFALSLASVITVYNEPNKYTGKWMGVTGLIIGGLLLLLVIII